MKFRHTVTGGFIKNNGVVFDICIGVCDNITDSLEDRVESED